jgi:hypothetical protein
MKVKTFKPATQLIGQVVPDNKDGHAGRYVEKLLEQMGVPINRGHGPDIDSLGLEIKTRDIDASSPQTVADMKVDDIINTSYKNSHVCKKFQQQLRVYTKDNVIISAEVYDFSITAIQDLIESAYNHAQAQVVQNPELTRTEYKGQFGYFERVSANRKSLSFRLSKEDMAKLEKIATSMYKHLFTE